MPGEETAAPNLQLLVSLVVGLGCRALAGTTCGSGQGSGVPVGVQAPTPFAWDVRVVAKSATVPSLATMREPSW
jgi:hypothetical protein